MRVNEMVTDPNARALIGCLLVRGDMNVVTYAEALEHLTGVEVTQLVPVPDLIIKAFKETRKYEEHG